MAEQEWWKEHDNVVLLVRWMADNHYDVNVVADVVEKPWKYEDEFGQALAALAEEV